MEESMLLFATMTAQESFKSVPIMLIFNHIETDVLWKEKLREKPICDYFPDYQGDPSYLKAIQYFAERFSKIDNRPNGMLRMYFANAVDLGSLRPVLRDIEPILTKSDFGDTSGHDISTPFYLSSTHQLTTVDIAQIPGTDLPQGRHRLSFNRAVGWELI